MTENDNSNDTKCPVCGGRTYTIDTERGGELRVVERINERNTHYDGHEVFQYFCTDSVDRHIFYVRRIATSPAPQP